MAAMLALFQDCMLLTINGDKRNAVDPAFDQRKKSFVYEIINTLHILMMFIYICSSNSNVYKNRANSRIKTANTSDMTSFMARSVTISYFGPGH